MSLQTLNRKDSTATTETSSIEDSRARSNTDMQLLKKFWVRRHGASVKLTRFKVLSQLSAGSQLAAAIFAGNHSLAREIITRHKYAAVWYFDFVKLVGATGFANLAYENACQAGLFNQFTRASSPRSTERKSRWKEVLRKRLKRLCVIQLAEVENANAGFLKVCDAFDKIQASNVWIKGTALGRSLYSNENDRLDCDLDCVTDESAISELVETARAELAYAPIFTSSQCFQMGVGPISTVADLLLTPSTDIISSSPLTMIKQGAPPIDFKTDPLCRGLRMVDRQRFQRDAKLIEWQGRQIKIPTVTDSLLICALNLTEHDRFENWRCLFDIHLLATELNKTPEEWLKLVASARVEGARLATWASLTLAVDRFQTVVPISVLNSLRPFRFDLLRQWFAFSTNTGFLWNANSLAVLLLTAVISESPKRYLQALIKSCLPTRDFLRRYYGADKNSVGEKRSGAAVSTTNSAPKSSIAEVSKRLLQHWLVLMLPGGLVRHTLGRRIWY